VLRSAGLPRDLVAAREVPARAETRLWRGCGPSPQARQCQPSPTPFERDSPPRMPARVRLKILCQEPNLSA